MNLSLSFVVGVLLLLNYAKTKVVIDGVSMSTLSECYRVCKENDEPKICYLNMTLEYYMVLGSACQVCTPNNTNQFTASCQCVLADGVEKGLLTANRMYPGPSLQVCKGDKIVVDVINRIEGVETTIHWHGVFQKGSQYSDGAPYITQCPIQEFTTFRYQFKADNEGTHFWHSHSGLQKLDGLCGTLIIREPQSVDLSGKLYDFDLSEHVILLTDWAHEYAASRFPGRISFMPGQHPDSILINGKGQSENHWTGCCTKTPLEVFRVTRGKRYRFRIINGFANVCPAELTIEKHNMTVIASDGKTLQPAEVGSIVSFSGERYDFMLTANQLKGSFWIQVRATGECWAAKTQQLAILTYDNEPTPASTAPTYDSGLFRGKILNPSNISFCVNGSSQGLCVHQLKNVINLQTSINKKPDVQIKLFYQFELFTPAQFHQPGTYRLALIPLDSSIDMSLINGIHFENPASPLLSQIKDVPLDIMCNDNTKPKRCANSTTCTCTQIYNVPLNGLVEILLVDAVGNANVSHPFHLHGSIFHIVDLGTFTNGTLQTINATVLKTFEDQGLIKRNLVNPPSKDTVAVPVNGYAVLRFVATNPGYWLFHCHFLYHTVIGMNIVIHVGGQADVPPVPRGFPVCGNFTPSINPNASQIY